MQEKELKTSTGQRIAIGAIAVVMVGAIIAGYAAIVASGNNSSSSSSDSIDQAKVAQYQQEYTEKQQAFSEASQSDFEKFAPFMSEVVAYNETAANEGGLQTKDLLIGEGRELTEGDKDYLAYYVGWCADESVFDSSLDNQKGPTKFVGAIDASGGLIEGWDQGVIGMKLGGIRELTIPSELAYKDTQEICGGTNKPLKFMVMAVANEDPLKSAAADINLAITKLQYAQYGLDYDKVAQEMQEAQGNSAESSETSEETSGE